MKYARVINEVAVDVVDAVPSSLFTEVVAVQFETVADDIAPGWLRLPKITSEAMALGTTWQPPGTFINEYEPGKFRYEAGEAPAPVVFPNDRKDRKHITNLAFLKRFSDAEAIALDLASIGATVAAASIRRYLNLVNAARYIDLNRAETRAGVLALEAAGLLQQGRALQILDAPVQPHEISPE